MVIAGNSPDLAQTLVSHPEFLESLTRDAFMLVPKQFKDFCGGLRDAVKGPLDLKDKREQIRLFKRYEMLRIGVRDLMKWCELPVVLAELSDLADALIDASLNCVYQDIGEKRKAEKVPFAIMALGKWGSREMGYYSDLDALFVYEGNEEEAQTYQKISQKVICSVSEEEAGGFLYKMDVRLRPGGKNDILILPLDGYQQYYAEKLQTWEMQTLTRMRFAAGDRDLGRRFMQMAETFVYARALTQEQVIDVQMMRARMTKEKVSVSQKGSHVKLDVGGIVDVEFAAQLLQLHWGWKIPAMRHGTTLEILRRGRDEDILGEEAFQSLSQGYVFLREVENKIRMVSGMPTELIPQNSEAQYHLVRRLGFLNGDTQKSVDAFWRKYRDCTSAVRRAFEEICEAVKIL